MNWTLLIPTSMVELGAAALSLSIPLQILTPKNSKPACWLALIGGFGVGGGVGGWLGRLLTNSGDTVATTTQQFMAQALGAGFGMLPFAILAILFWKKAGREGEGLESSGGNGKSKGNKGKYVKQVGWLMAFALLGTAIAGLPKLYWAANNAVAFTGGHLQTALSGVL